MRHKLPSFKITKMLLFLSLLDFTPRTQAQHFATMYCPFGKSVAILMSVTEPSLGPNWYCTKEYLCGDPVSQPFWALQWQMASSHCFYNNHFICDAWPEFHSLFKSVSQFSNGISQNCHFHSVSTCCSPNNTFAHKTGWKKRIWN